MATTIKSTELDFNTIKNNLKTALAAKSEFADYNFEASGLSNILDVLAVNTHYNGLIANFALNESFLTTSQTRSAMVNHSLNFGYSPRSKSGAKAVVNLNVNLVGVSPKPTSITLPQYSRFNATIDDITYTFYTLDDYVGYDRTGSGIYTFEEDNGKEHLALTFGDVEGQDTALCRVHSECLTGDALHSLRCDCGPQLQAALQMLAENKSGILLYLRQEGRGIGLVNKIRAYALQDQGHDTVEANELLGFAPDLREYNICLDILQHFKISSVNLLTNNPKKVSALEEVGISVTKRTSLHEGENEKNKNYLDTKRDKMGHLR